MKKENVKIKDLTLMGPSSPFTLNASRFSLLGNFHIG